MKVFGMMVTFLLIIVGLNWRLVGLFEFDLVQNIFGEGVFARVIYTVVGLLALCKVILGNTWMKLQNGSLKLLQK